MKRAKLFCSVSFLCTHTQVYVDQFCSLFINKNVLNVPIAQTNDVTNCQTQKCHYFNITSN